MKWYITQSDRIIPEVNSVRVIRREMGSEAASTEPKWETPPVVTRIAGPQEIPRYVPVLDGEGNLVLDENGMPTSIQDGVTLVDITEAVEWPYLVLDGTLLRDATAEERVLLDAELAGRAEAAAVAFAAASAAYLEGYDVLPRPLQGKFETPADDGHVYAFEVDPDTEEPFCVQRMSTRTSNASHESKVAARNNERKAHRQRIAAIKDDLDGVETALDQVDVTAGGVMGVAIAATTGTTKTALTEVRKVLVDVKAALKNLMQAVEKLRKDAR